MNKIYKVIWNRKIGSFVVASEAARSCGKRSSSTRRNVIAGAVLSGTALFGLSGQALAANEDISLGDAVAITGDGTNISMNLDGDKITVSLEEEVDLGTNGSLTVGSSKLTDGKLDIGGTTLEKDKLAIGTTVLTDSQLTIGATTIDNNGFQNNNTTVDGTGLTINSGPSVTTSGIDAGDQKITNVANGNTTNDAVNYGQLKELEEKLYGNSSDQVLGIKYFHANSTKADSAADGEDSVAIGPESEAGANDSFAAGHGAKVEGGSDSSIALGTDAKVGGSSTGAIAMGDQAQVLGAANNGLAIGTEAKATEENAIAIGHGVNSAINAVGIGNEAQAVAKGGIALGSNAQVQTHDSIAIGTGAGVGTVYKNPDDGARHSHIAIGETSGQNVKGNESIAIGVNAGSNVTNDFNIAIGSQAGTHINGERNVALGYKANENGGETNINHAVALGGKTNASTDAVAIGYLSQSKKGAVSIGESAAADSLGVAIGQGAKAEGDFISLGRGSIAHASDIIGSGYMTGTGFTGTALSVGDSSTGLTRRITNVADGAQDQDVVTVAQLKALKDDIGSFTPESGGNANYNSDGTLSVADAVTSGEAVNLGQMNDAITDSKVEYFSVDPNGDTANKDNTGAAGANSMAIGHASSTNGESSLSVGHHARVTDADRATSVGYKTLAKSDNSTAIGSESVVDDTAGVAIGRTAYSRGENSLAMGTGAQTGEKGSGQTIENAIAFGTESRATATDASAMGHSATARGLKSNAIGFEALAAEESASAIGTNAQAINTNSFALGTKAIAAGKDSFAQGTSAHANTQNAIAIGTKSNSGYEGDDSANPKIPATTNTIAIGQESNALGQNSLAVGTNNKVGNKGSGKVNGADSGAFGNNNVIHQDNTFVVGNEVTTSQANSVVLGNKSTDRAATKEEKVAINGETYNFKGVGHKDYGVVSVGQSGEERQIINVAAGKVSADSTDAINGSQLFAVKEAVEVPITFMGDAGTEVDRNLGDQLNIVGGVTDQAALTEGNIGVVANGTDGLEVKLAKDIDLGDDGSVKTGDTVINNGGLNITNGPKFTKTEINAGGNTINNLKAGVNDTDAVNVSQLNTKVGELADTPLTFAGDSGTAVDRKLGQKLNIVGGETDETNLTEGNIGVVADGNDKLEVKLAKDIDLGSDGSVKTGDTVINNGGLTIDGGPKFTKDVIDAGGNQINNLAEGTEGTDAVNLDQLKDAVDGLAQDVPITFKGDTGDDVDRKLGQELNIVGGEDDETKLTDDNIGVVANGTDELEVKLAKDIDLGDDGSVKTGDTEINNDGLTVDDGAGNKTTTGATGTTVTDGTNTTTIEANTITVSDGTTDGTSNIGPGHATFGPVTINDGGNGTVNGLTNLTFNPSNRNSGQAATEDQLYALGDILNVEGDGTNNFINYNGTQFKDLAAVLDSIHWDVDVSGSGSGSSGSGGSGSGSTGGSGSSGSGNSGSDSLGGGNATGSPETGIHNGDKVTFVAGDNINIDKTPAGGTGDTDITFSLADDIKLNSVTVNNVKADTVQADTVEAKAVMIQDGPTLDENGIDMNGKRIRNMAPGVDGTDAVNVNQLNKLAQDVNAGMNHLDNKINRNDRRASAGIAAAIATAGLPQAYLPGKSMFSMAGGVWRGESGYAMGLSTVSDNGKWILKGTASGSSRGDYGGSVGVGYQW